MAQGIAKLVDEAVALDNRIADDQARLKTLKKQLIAEAKRRKPQQIEDGGKRVVMAGSNGNIARVVWPKPTLKTSIKGGGKTFEQIDELADDAFATLFAEKPTTYALAADFRDKVHRVFAEDPKAGRKLIDLCTSKSSPTVSFETKHNPEHTS